MNSFQKEKESYSQNLKEFMQQEILNKHLSPKNLADKLEGFVSSSTIYNICDKKTNVNITLFTFKKICEAMDITEVDFLHRFNIHLLNSNMLENKD